MNIKHEISVHNCIIISLGIYIGLMIDFLPSLKLIVSNEEKVKFLYYNYYNILVMIVRENTLLIVKRFIVN